MLNILQRLTWEETRRELVQRDGHDFGCEAEGIFNTYRERGEKKNIMLCDIWTLYDSFQDSAHFQKLNITELNCNLVINVINKQNRQKKLILIKHCREPDFV